MVNVAVYDFAGSIVMGGAPDCDSLDTDSVPPEDGVTGKLEELELLEEESPPQAAKIAASPSAATPNTANLTLPNIFKKWLQEWNSTAHSTENPSLFPGSNPPIRSPRAYSCSNACRHSPRLIAGSRFV